MKDYIVGAFVGALLATIAAAVAFPGQSLSWAKEQAINCMADGGTYEHCVNKYLMGKKQ